MKRILAAFTALVLAGIGTAPAHAAWPTSPTVGVPVCTASGGAFVPELATDGAGGAFVTWLDARSSNYTVFVQHVLASGIVDPTWPVNGRLASAPDTAVYQPCIVADGAGGAYVAWGFGHLAVTHVLATGVVDPAWPARGLILAPSGLSAAAGASFKANRMLAYDGSGGVLVAWSDQRNGPWTVHVQHVLVTGTTDPAWPPLGRDLGTTTGYAEVSLSSDPIGYAIVVWMDEYTGVVRAQHVFSDGGLDDQWPPGGVVLGTSYTTSPNLYSGVLPPAIVSDGALGALVAWHSQYDRIRIQHLVPNGPLDPAWPAGGVDYVWPVQVASYLSQRGRIEGVSDAAGGAYFAFFGDALLAGTHVAANGSLVSDVRSFSPQRSFVQDNGIGEHPVPALAPDGSGGMIAAGQFVVSSSSDLYAQRTLAVPGSAPGWPLTGIAVGTATGAQSDPAALDDGHGGVILAWSDRRAGPANLYAQRISAGGQLVGVGDPLALAPPIALAAPAPNPASRATTLRYALPAAARVSLRIYDTSGRLVRTLLADTRPAGEHTAGWDLQDDRGHLASTGIYFARLDVEGRSFVRRFAVVR